MLLVLIIDWSKAALLKNTARLYANSKRRSQAITQLRPNHIQGYRQ